MRISADCIDQEVDIAAKDQQLSQQFSRMALNDEDIKAGDQIRVIYKANYDNSVLTSLSVIPVTDYHRNGYYSEWEEVKRQIIDLSFHGNDKSKIPQNLKFMAVIQTLEYELDINSREDYFTALKMAELYGQPLDVMIKASQESVIATNGSVIPQPIPSKASNSTEKLQSSSNDANNGFILLNPSNITASEDKMVVISEKQIEKIKKEITIDVTKRLITKLNECLTELTTNDSPQSQSQEYVNDYLTGAESSPSIPKVVHKGIICDHCDQQIEGIRYKCINCLDYDLCEACRQKAVHFPDHTFNKIERYIRGIPKQTLPPNLDFLKPFLSGATIDPSTKDVILTLDVDLTNGTISKSNVSQPMNSERANDENSNQNNQQSDQNNKKNTSDDEYYGMIGPQLPQKRYCSEKRAKQITKKLEKLKQKSQLYNNILQTNEDRHSLSTNDRIKSVPVIQNPASNKTLYLSGLLIGDETIPEGTRMPPNTKFRKTWRVRNTGTKVWSGRTTLKFVWGHPELEPFGKVTEVQAPTLRPGEEGKVTIRFTSPNASTVTRYQSYWRLHHRGQPFGPRLVVKIIVDPMATVITPAPTTMAPILSKESRNSIGLPTTSKISTAVRHCPPYVGPYSVDDNTCNLEAMAPIQQLMFKGHQEISNRLQMSNPTKQPTLVSLNKEKTQKTSAKKLTEALSQVKELRFDLDENETIPMKPNVKSHTTTPANTPFDVSPPKSPEPNTSTATFSQLETAEKTENDECNDQQKEETSAKDNGNESDGESLDVLSLSSGNESSDEFVLVPFPSCFDLNVPFALDNNKDVNSNSDSSDNSPQSNTELNCFEIVDNQNKGGDPSESDDDNTRQTEEKSNDPQERKDILSEPNEEIALDLTKEKVSENVCSETHPKQAENQTPTQTNSSSDTEPQVRCRIPNPSTNPFTNNTSETENVIHVLPESIVTGALSAAAHVYNNVSRALFSRNEGNNFAWVTSPPPAALPLPNMYWDSRGNQYHQTQHHFGPYGSQNMNPMPAPTAPHMTTTSNGDQPQPQEQPHPNETTTRLTSSLKQLYEMGFWNQKLNQELLEKNDFDVNDTIEDLLSPDKSRHNRQGATPSTPSAEQVVSHQPTNSNDKKGFIDEFD